jgi:two-component system sensor kinase FixL
VALTLVALLVILNQVLVQPPLLRLMTDAPVINMAGRQRMLSQRLAKAALALRAAEDAAARRRYREELDRVVRLWSASHDGLRRGDRGLSLPGGNSPAVAAAFDELEPYFSGMRGAVLRMVRGGPQPAARGDLETILELEGPFLERMDRIVGLYERETRARLDRLLRGGWAVTGLILVALLGIGGFILRPAARLVDRQLAELREARDSLEARVRERTAELERAEQRHRALVEQFSHVARTTTIGEMASGLAHELNQPLGAIANYVQGCLVVLEAPRPASVPDPDGDRDLEGVRTALEKVLATTLRAGEILRRIRRFVTRHEVAHERFEPNRVVAEVEEVVRDDARRRGIALETRLAPELPCLEGDPVQIQQVLVNLVRNAFDALSASEVLDPKVLMQTERGPSGAVEFRVTDNGEGIPADRLPRVFDAYFSTRAEGMGMGLAISRTIVEAHRGRIWAESTPTVRTTFQFTLPAPGGADAR